MKLKKLKINKSVNNSLQLLKNGNFKIKVFLKLKKLKINKNINNSLQLLKIKNREFQNKSIFKIEKIKNQ